MLYPETLQRKKITSTQITSTSFANFHSLKKEDNIPCPFIQLTRIYGYIHSYEFIYTKKEKKSGKREKKVEKESWEILKKEKKEN